MTISSERFRVPEIMFDPSLCASEYFGDAIHKMIYNTVLELTIKRNDNNCNNIVLSGGNALFPGMSSRVEKELKALCPSDWNFQISVNEKRGRAAFCGSSMFAALESFQTESFSASEYAETGQAAWRKR
jgi:actin-related protein 6